MLLVPSPREDEGLLAGLYGPLVSLTMGLVDIEWQPPAAGRDVPDRCPSDHERPWVSVGRHVCPWSSPNSCQGPWSPYPARSGEHPGGSPGTVPALCGY